MKNTSRSGDKTTTATSDAHASKKLQKNIETIVAMEKEAVASRTPMEHLADKITTFAGSTPFLIFHFLWFTGWIVVNSGWIPGIGKFDPFPFSFLTLVVSLEAIFLTLLVLMSQNRMTLEADKRAQLDLQINLLDEQETTVILRLVQKIATHIGIDTQTDQALDELCEETDLTRVVKEIEEKTKEKK